MLCYNKAKAKGEQLITAVKCLCLDGVEVFKLALVKGYESLGGNFVNVQRLQIEQLVGGSVTVEKETYTYLYIHPQLTLG